MARTVAAMLVGAVLLAGCDTFFPTSSPDANQSPRVRLAENVPVPGDTLEFSLVTMHWKGGDPDGYVTGYEYRIFTTYCRTACAPVELRDVTSETWEGWLPATFDDSTGWRPTGETSQTIVFPSRADVNQQVFQVRTVDNSGVVSKPDSASTRIFYTPNSAPPMIEILDPQDGAARFIQEETNDWWQGVELAFTGTVDNPQKEIVEYGWRLDEQAAWHWVNDTSLVIGPDDFEATGRLAGAHTVYVTARDNTNLLAHEGGSGDSISIELVRPTFERGLLIVDETDEEAGGGYVQADDATVDSVFAAAFEPDGTWDVAADGLPPRSVLGQYEMVFWHADNFYASVPHLLPDHADAVADYLNMGGDLILSGARVLASFTGAGTRLPSSATGAGAPFADTSFVRAYMHIAAAKETPQIAYQGDLLMAGANGSSGFSDVSVDGEKLPAFPFSGTVGTGENARSVKGLLQVNVISERASFTEAIYSFEGAGPTGWNGQAVGIKYYGTVFDAVVFGFPLWFLENEDINTLAEEVRSSFQSTE